VNYLFPLYLFPGVEKKSLFDDDAPTDAPGGRRPNLAPEFIIDFSARLKLRFIPDGKGDLKETFGPEDVFDYLYAVFHSPAYRVRYAEFLKSDFPRLPLTSNAKLFQALCDSGKELVGLHLTEKHSKPVTGYPRPGDSTVEQVRYDEQERRVWINKKQYFEGVPPEV
jgi:predicted helicase